MKTCERVEEQQRSALNCPQINPKPYLKQHTGHRQTNDGCVAQPARHCSWFYHLHLLCGSAVTTAVLAWVVVCCCCWLLQVVQFLTVDYGIEFCDYYGARCNRQMIETCRVKQVPDIPSSVKLSWVEHKVPIPIKGQGTSAAAAATPLAPSPLAEAPVTSSTFSLI